MQTTDFLRKYNDFDVVLALTDVGPKYLLKAQTVSFRRLNKNLYYNNKFVNVLMACMLQHRGKSEPTFLHLTEHFLARGSPCALLGTRNRLTRRTLMEEVWSLPSIQQFHSGLIGKNTEKGEWQILSHDATFKALFSVIGQRKMALAPGEGHALHSLLGLSGALAGLSLQHAEGPKCFADAVTSLLPEDARRTTLWVFTDSPDTVQKADHCFPQLQGVAEDPLHFVLRVEACFGEKRTALSRNLLHLQKKFAHALDCTIFKGGAAPKAHEGARSVVCLYQHETMLLKKHFFIAWKQVAMKRLTSHAMILNNGCLFVLLLITRFVALARMRIVFLCPHAQTRTMACSTKQPASPRPELYRLQPNSLLGSPVLHR